MRKLLVLILSIVLVIISVDYNRKGKAPVEPAKKGMKRAPVRE